jgi:drug/metabolite transporter (DMT)-like permease
MAISYLIVIILAAITASVGSLFLKFGAEKFHIAFTLKGIMDILENWKLLLGIFLYVLSAAIFIVALSMADLSVAYPLTSISYIFVTILSAIFLKERIHLYKVLGVGFIILGVVLVTL